MNISVGHAEEGKKWPKRAEGEIISFSQQDMSACSHLHHVTWQKKCPHSWPIFPCKHRWRTVLEKMAPKVLEHKTNHRPWTSTHWKVTVVALPWWPAWFSMCCICIHACARTSVLPRLFNSHFSYCLKVFLPFFFFIRNSSSVHRAQTTATVCKTKAELQIGGTHRRAMFWCRHICPAPQWGKLSSVGLLNLYILLMWKISLVCFFQVRFFEEWCRQWLG